MIRCETQIKETGKLIKHINSLADVQNLHNVMFVVYILLKFSVCVYIYIYIYSDELRWTSKFVKNGPQSSPIKCWNLLLNQQRPVKTYVMFDVSLLKLRSRKNYSHLPQPDLKPYWLSGVIVRYINFVCRWCKSFSTTIQTISSRIILQ